MSTALVLGDTHPSETQPETEKGFLRVRRGGGEGWIGANVYGNRQERRHRQLRN